ncbi:DUF177 domain-containing protein [Deferribacter thermophilus]|uniref:YceD family protein n=1 Tax=Deferribacter thermophilus TaxID=53573 RepID=UPI003C238063
MKVFFEQIKSDGLKIDTKFEFEYLDSHIVVENFTGDIYPIKKGYFLDGMVTFSVKSACDRCTEIVQKGFSERIQLEIVRDFSEDTEEEKELTEEDLSFYKITDDYIEIDDIIKEEVTLLKPMKWLCKEGCKGICPGCGADLNREKCSCTADFIDPRLEVLKKLKNK